MNEKRESEEINLLTNSSELSENDIGLIDEINSYFINLNEAYPSFAEILEFTSVKLKIVEDMNGKRILLFFDFDNPILEDEYDLKELVQIIRNIDLTYVSIIFLINASNILKIFYGDDYIWDRLGIDVIEEDWFFDVESIKDFPLKFEVEWSEGDMVLGLNINKSTSHPFMVIPTTHIKYDEYSYQELKKMIIDTILHERNHVNVYYELDINHEDEECYVEQLAIEERKQLELTDELQWFHHKRKQI